MKIVLCVRRRLQRDERRLLGLTAAVWPAPRQQSDAQPHLQPFIRRLPSQNTRYLILSVTGPTITAGL